MATIKWTLTDPLDSSSHTFQFNPNTKGGMGEIPYERIANVGSQAQSGVLITEPQRALPTSSFDLTVLFKTEYETLWDWYSRDRALVLTDDLGRSQTIFITDFIVKRERSIDYPYKHSITCNYTVLALTDI